MRGVYTVSIEINAVQAAKTLLLGENGSTNALQILRAKIINKNINTPEQLFAGLYRVTTKGAPAGNTSDIKIQKGEKGDPASVVTWIGGLTTEPTLYDDKPLDYDAMPNVCGYHYDPFPEERQIIGPSELFGLRLLQNLTASTNLAILLRYIELKF